jgi:hypothetical protein
MGRHPSVNRRRQLRIPLHLPIAALAVVIALATPWSASPRADEAREVLTFGPGTPTPRPVDIAALRPAGPVAAPSSAARTTFPLLTGFVPISEMPTEDVDVVEVMSVGMGPILVWPTEGIVHFFPHAPGPQLPPMASLPTPSPNITGVDFVSDGTWGVFATLGFLNLYDLTGPVPVPAASVPLIGSPARRDIDPRLIAHPASPSGVAALYATGTEIWCVAVPTGAPLWMTPLPSPVVEAVDPQINAANTLVFAPTEGWMTAIDAVSGGILSSTPLSTTLVREVDARFVLGDALCYLPATGSLFVFDGTPPGAGGIGALVAAIPVPSFYIEGNDLEVEASGTYGFIPTLAAMLQVDLGAIAIAATHPFTGAVHQRNHDAVFSDPAMGPPRAVYATQGLAWVYDIFTLSVFAVLPTPGTLVDGVDPVFTDAPPAGTVAILPTMGFTHFINAAAGAVATVTTPGVLRTDVDARPGPEPGNKLVQPVLGGLFWAEAFTPTEWVVPVSGGCWSVDPAAGLVLGFTPYPGLTYRGGDAQATALLPGPIEPAYSIDDPDQDFLTKCWEYKYAINRWPYWWSYAPFADYPTWIPFGPFGPPALLGYDIMNDFKVFLMGSDGVFPNQVGILDAGGGLIQTIACPDEVISGVIWDYDNKHVKLRMRNQLELVINLATLAWSPFASYYFHVYADYGRYYPVVDRMNGWQFIPMLGHRRVYVYDHLNGVAVTTINLPARIIRRPVFDEQRKTLVMPLANRQVAFINGHRLRLGLPNAVYYSPVLPAHVVGTPVFDLYNHYTVCKLYGGRLAVLDNHNGFVVWDSGVLPYWPVGPLQIDCYNKIGKGFFRDALFNYHEMWLNLFPLAFGGVPALQWLPVPGVPYGYPLFDSRDGYEFYRTNTDLISYRYLFNPLAGGILTTPFPMAGNLFFDRVNKYGLVRLQGPYLYWMNLHRVTSGLAGATNLISLPVPAVDDIVFDTQGHYAAVHLQDGRVALVDMHQGALTHLSNGLPLLERQLYVHPFRHLINWPSKVPPIGPGQEVTVDLAPIRWNPPQLPYVQVVNTPAIPVESDDFNPPPPLIPIEIVQLSLQSGDASGVVHFRLTPAATDPGNIIQVRNLTTFDTANMDEPAEAVQDDSGCEISVIAQTGDQLCFVAFDMAGNASPPTCIAVGPVVGVTPGAAPESFGFALTSRLPARDDASFHLSLPERAHVELSLFDVAGRRVATLLDESRPAGEHDVTWDLTGERGGAVAPGVYFASVRAGEHRARVRVVVLR